MDSAVRAVWAVIRHKAPEKMPNSGPESQGRLPAGRSTDAKTEGSRGKVSQAEGNKYAKAGAEGDHGALSKLNIIPRKEVWSP